MKKTIMMVILIMVLSSCATPMPKSSPMPEGEKVSAPSGWVDYKKRGGE